MHLRLGVEPRYDTAKPLASLTIKQALFVSSNVHGGRKRRGPAVILCESTAEHFTLLAQSFGCEPVSGPGGGEDFAGGGG
jgi:hypothetical protein